MIMLDPSGAHRTDPAGGFGGSRRDPGAGEVQPRTGCARLSPGRNGQTYYQPILIATNVSGAPARIDEGVAGFRSETRYEQWSEVRCQPMVFSAGGTAACYGPMIERRTFNPLPTTIHTEGELYITNAGSIEAHSRHVRVPCCRHD
jgi:hypothetical protein